MNKVRHVLGISGGKDSAALAIYLKKNYPDLNIEYYFCDTGKELKETYYFIETLQSYLGKEIIMLRAAKNNPESPFDFYFHMYGGYLPSKNARWCTKNLKLAPFEDFIRDDLVVSYVGIRGDEEREGYISKKSNIQSIFPFRKNIWSEDVIKKILNNSYIPFLIKTYEKVVDKERLKKVLPIIERKVSPEYLQKKKNEDLLAFGIRDFNYVISEFLKNTGYPLSFEESYPLLENEENLVEKDIYEILENSGAGLPKYYHKIEFDVDGKKGFYSRTRSGCFFCFFQRKIEWIWLYEQHPDLFKQAMEYEKSGFTWLDNEPLKNLIQPDRIKKIKEKHLIRARNASRTKSPYLVDILKASEKDGCAICFL